VNTPARAVFALLVLACFLAFFISQHLKHTPTVLQSVRETPYFAPGVHGHELEHISFKTKEADLVTVTVQTAAGANVATLVNRTPVPRYRQCEAVWNGLTGHGRLAPAGTYTLSFSFVRQDRTIPSPASFKLEARVASPPIPRGRTALTCIE
jgi:hypothetical protein